VLDEIAVLTRAGAASRRLESATIAAALQPWRSLVEITAPATLDGGDVLQIGRTLYVGLSSRSNSQGATQLRELLGRFGYRVESVAVSGCLHLKSAATAISDTRVLVNPAWCDPKAFAPAQIITVEPSEPYAANALRLDDCVVMDQAHPETAARLRTLGVSVHLVDLSELAKAEGAVTCCSLVFAV
jgi:dimethylargininase